MYIYIIISIYYMHRKAYFEWFDLYGLTYVSGSISYICNSRKAANKVWFLNIISFKCISLTLSVACIISTGGCLYVTK